MADQYVYSPLDFCADCWAAGFRVGAGLANILAIAGAESRFNPAAKNIEGNAPSTSVDRGIIQINSYWHPEVSDECAYDPPCAAVQGYRISGKGTTFTAWVTYLNGAYKAWLPTAWLAIDAFQRIFNLKAQITNQGLTIADLGSRLTDSQRLAGDLQKRNSELLNQIAQLQGTDSELQKTIVELQQQVTQLTVLSDAAVARAESAEGEVTHITSNVDKALAARRSEILG